MSITHPEGRHVVLNGKRIWVEMLGEGSSLLLLAGGPGASHAYMHGYDMLARSHRLIFVDVLGTGRSDRSEPCDYTVERWAEDLEALRITLAIPQWDVLGHSFGGLLGGVYATRHPASVRRLVISNSALSGQMFQDAMDCVNVQIRQQFPEAWERSEALRATGMHANHPEHMKAFDVPTEVVYWYNGATAAQAIFDMSMDVLYTALGPDADFTIGSPIREIDFRDALEALDVPLLIIGGRYDRQVTPHLLRTYQRRLPRAKLMFFERSGHQPFLEEPELTGQVITEFFASSTAATR